MAASVKRTVNSDPTFTVQSSEGNKSLAFGGVTTVSSLQLRAASAVTIIINGSITIPASALRFSANAGQITAVTVSTGSVSPVSVSYTLVE
jgi:hypothetical protein